MKFGANLPNLSINKWILNNFDYNSIKNLIKDDDSTINILKSNFTDEFIKLNSFIKVNYLNIREKLDYILKILLNLDQSNTYKLDLLKFNIYQIFKQVLVFSKFLIVNKLAITKIFKKLKKYYKNAKLASSLVVHLNDYLLKQQYSIHNIDLVILITSINQILWKIERIKKSNKIDTGVHSMKVDEGKVFLRVDRREALVVDQRGSLPTVDSGESRPPTQFANKSSNYRPSQAAGHIPAIVLNLPEDNDMETENEDMETDSEQKETKNNSEQAKLNEKQSGTGFEPNLDYKPSSLYKSSKSNVTSVASLIPISRNNVSATNSFLKGDFDGADSFLRGDFGRAGKVSTPFDPSGMGQSFSSSNHSSVEIINHNLNHFYNGDYSNSHINSAYNSSMNSQVNLSSLSTSSKNKLHVQQSPTTKELDFDLVLLLKKNFKLCLLSPPDLFQDLLLNLNLNFKMINSISSDDYLSYIYLSNNELFDPPSYIVSNSNLSSSIVISYIGGLRKYSYCILPNNIVDYLLKYLNNDTSVKDLLYNYFFESNISSLTRKTIDTILSKSLVPKLKLICKRERFIMKNEQGNGDDIDNTDDIDGGDDGKMGSYTDDYMITLNHTIYTSNTLISDLNFDFSEFDVFPHNVINIHTNDFNLFNFESSLESDFQDNQIINSYNSSFLKQLPSKLKNLIDKNNNLSLFKGFEIYSYMLSCYFNKISPEKISNHYSNVLNLNLFKKWENSENFNHQLAIEYGLIKKKSTVLLNRHFESKSDLSSLPSDGANSILPSIFDDYYIENPNGYFSGNDDSWTEYDSYETYLNLMSKSTVFTEFIHKFIKFKNRLSNNFMTYYNSDIESVGSFDYYTSPKPNFSSMSLISNGNGKNYNSINVEENVNIDCEAESFKNDLELLYEADYDLTLSYLYFIATTMAIFLSGIELGVMYSTVYLSEGEAKEVLMSNLWLVGVVVFGFLLSIILALTAINISLLRFNSPPRFHYFILWAGFIIIINCCIWSAAILLA